MPFADARAGVPGLAVAEADPAADLRFLATLADACDRYTPMVALDPPNGLLLDIAGAAHLFGGETALAADALKRFGRRLTVRHALADTPDAAAALARLSPGSSGAMEDIMRLPVDALGLPPEDSAALRRAGLKRIADLAARPTAPLSARFGAATLALERLLGRIDSRITPRRPLPALHFARRFAEPVAQEDDVRAALAALVAQAAQELDRRGVGGRSFHVRLWRSDGAVRGLAIETGLPTRDAARIDRLFRERIETLSDPLDPGFGFDLMQLAIAAVEPLSPVQAGLDSRGHGPEALDALVDRLSTRHGRARIRRLLPVESHVPERAVRAVAALDAPGLSWPAPPAGEPPLRPIALFDPPQPVEALSEVPDAPPVRFRWRGRMHRVTRAEGPERIAAPWWKAGDEGRPTRDYYRVEDSDGRRFWLFRHGLHDRESVTARWYLHGLFA